MDASFDLCLTCKINTQRAMFLWTQTEVFWAELRQDRHKVASSSMASDTDEQMEKTMLCVLESRYSWPSAMLSSTTAKILPL